jgi:hypothetical protein
MTYFFDPDGFGRFQRTAKAAVKDANGQHLRAILVGYNVSPSTGAELGNYRVNPARLGNEPTTSFIVWRIDQTPESGQTFGTVEAVRQYLDQLETLPRFCLDLADDPKTEVAVVGDDVFRVTVTEAAGSRLTFSMRVASIAVVTDFCVHAARENRPTLGNWREVN